MHNVSGAQEKFDLRQASAFACSKGWLSRQSIEFQKGLCGKAKLKSFAKNEPVFHVEDKAPEIYCLVQGVLLTLVVHPVSGLLAGNVIYPGDWFGEPAALGRRPRLTSVHARLPSQAIAVSQVAVENMLASNPSFNSPFFDLMANNAEQYMLHAVDLLIQDPALRLRSRLLTLGGRRINYLPPSPVSIPLSQDELAAASGLSRRLVNQLLSDLERKGICELRYREIRINDMQALARMQDGPPRCQPAI